MAQVSATVHALIKEAVSRAAALRQTTPDNGHLPRLEALYPTDSASLVTSLLAPLAPMAMMALPAPGPSGPIQPSGSSGLPGPPGPLGGSAASTDPYSNVY